MNRISLPITQLQDHYDVIVIGSGYGGGVAASRLSRAGKKVCVMERGKEFIPGDPKHGFPGNLEKASEQMQLDLPDKKIGAETGMFNFHIGKDVTVLVGCGLGGTSLINANVSLKLDPRVWQNGLWPKALLADLETGVARGYDRAQEMLKPNPYPQSFPSLAKMVAHEKSGVALGQPYYRTPINVNFEDRINHVGVHQNACNNCGDCVSGCNVTAKNTTQMNYLPDAWNHGAEIFTECHVEYISRQGQKWGVHFQPVGLGREKFHAPEMFVTADVVVVSAGTLGSTKIMLRSAQKALPLSTMLGKRFSGNGDVLGFGWNAKDPIHGIGYGDQPVDRSKPTGPCITTIIDTRETAKDYRDGMTVEEGSIPGALRSILAPSFSAIAALEGKAAPKPSIWNRLLSGLRKLLRIGESVVEGAHAGAVDHTQTYLIMSHDKGDGVMSLTPQNQVQINWPGYGKESIFEKANDTLKKCSWALGAAYLKNPVWDKDLNYELVSVHPLGGCIMGDDSSSGVVNHKGQVFNPAAGKDAVHEGLYITDGSVIPTSLGTNPLFTISAVSERNMELLAAERGWQLDYTLPSAPGQTPTPRRAGVRFTETMKGYFSTTVKNSDYQAGYEAGKLADSALEFTLTVESEDVDRIVSDANHPAGMAGTVSAAALSAEPLSVTRGQFNLFVNYAQEVGTRRMNYSMPLRSTDGRLYYFKGYKEVTDVHGPRIWPDTSTLYITIYDGADDTAPVLGNGILHIEMADFMRQMTTMCITNEDDPVKSAAAMMKFGSYFAGSLWDVYGGVLRKDKYFNPDGPPRKKRPLRVGAPAYHFFNTEDGLTLRLTRYQGGAKGPVILSHGLGVASSLFSTDTIDTNLLEYLFEHQYDVWLLDYRASIDLAYASRQYSGDEVAKYDYPAAVETVRSVTGRDTVQFVVHCWGATTWTMAMMAGLKHVRSAVVSQVSAFAVTGWLKEVEAALYMPETMSRLGIKDLTAYTDSHANFVNRLFDKAVHLMPPGHHQDCDNPVCHRITFLYGLLYQHQQLNQLLHDNLHELFGVACIKSLSHLTSIIRAGHVVDDKGQDVYMPHLARINVPTLFISGSENCCFKPVSTEKAYEALCKLNGPQLYKRQVIPGYGHIDCMFGKNAVKDVYPYILAHLDETNV